MMSSFLKGETNNKKETETKKDLAFFFKEP